MTTLEHRSNVRVMENTERPDLENYWDDDEDWHRWRRDVFAWARERGMTDDEIEEDCGLHPDDFDD